MGFAVRKPAARARPPFPTPRPHAGCAPRSATSWTHKRRKWCTSNICGNRARVARHYERTHADRTRRQALRHRRGTTVMARFASTWPSRAPGMGTCCAATGSVRPVTRTPGSCSCSCSASCTGPGSSRRQRSLVTRR
ncbi:CGNR zinc finger domain-containing protein [Streptomyces sp. NPDC056730]|uniref:CGNR zinc finger domain-containing protein n=1 Tax=unclassified Streptomyces TaxID=2593676 RepID=UPI00364BF5F0